MHRARDQGAPSSWVHAHAPDPIVSGTLGYDSEAAPDLSPIAHLCELKRGGTQVVTIRRLPCLRHFQRQLRNLIRPIDDLFDPERTGLFLQPFRQPSPGEARSGHILEFLLPGHQEPDAFGEREIPDPIVDRCRPFGSLKAGNGPTKCVGPVNAAAYAPALRIENGEGALNRLAKLLARSPGHE